MKEITKEEMEILLDSSSTGEEDYKPIGSFYMKDGNVYIGVDNSRGSAWVEEFDNLDECKKWLNFETEVGV